MSTFSPSWCSRRLESPSSPSHAGNTSSGPIGVPRDSYIWLKDRSGNTYGYANLFIPPVQFAKLGLLMQNGGVWQRGVRIPVHLLYQPGGR